MIRDARRRRLPAMKVLGLVSLFFAGCAALVAWMCSHLAGVLLIAAGLGLVAGGFAFLMLYCRYVFNRRFDPTHRALADAIRAGEIGRPEMLVLSSRDPEISPPDYVAAMPYGIFYDTMIHDFDMVRWLLAEEPVEITARTACMLDTTENPHRDPDTAMVMLTMASGALVHVNSSFRAVYGYDQRIEAFGSKGMLISRNHHPTALERYDAAGVRQDPLLRFFIERYAESYRRELHDFVQAIAARRPPSIGLVDGQRALQIAEAAVASAKSGKTIALRSWV
jgi:myo-inositol 2-dehydrogenase/D-chiro-inositol 1-dehydrogenase